MMNKFLFTGFALIAVMILASCEGGNDSAKKTKNKDDNESGVGDDDYGTEKSFDGVQLWYTSIITEKEADAMGSYLIESAFADGSEKIVQLNKSGNTYEFKMVVKTGIEQDQEYTELGKLFATEISNFVFNGEPVDVHFCDENLKTLRVLPMSNQIDDDYGTEKSFDGVQLWYTSIITEKEADAMGNYLIESGFSDGMEKTVQLNKSGNTYEFRMVVKTGIEQDQEYAELGKLLATEISTFVFNREPVDVHFCDENFKTLRVLLMSNQIEDAYDERSNQIEDDYDEMSNQIEDDYDEMANQIEDDYNEMANQIEEAYDEMANQIEDAYEVVVLDRSNNSECDEYLAGYEKFMDNYITILKKQQADPSDMSIMTEYMSIMTEGTEWASKTPDCTDMEFLGRLMEIQMKIANAASGMY
jgi:hypothetical protein